MNDITLQRENPNAIVLPKPRGGPISIRVAVPDGGADIKFIDGLQKKHSKMVGWMPTKQIVKRIEEGWYLIAEDELNKPVGYVLATDKYFKRDDCGIIYQLNVAPHKQRGLVGAALIKAVFERSSYACRLYCCWCAQDLEANYFWESIGFVPLAFRAGSRGKEHGGKRKDGRVHIFWQKRIREGDRSTPYWFPSETKGGALREARIVLPMLAGMHWSEAKSMVLPGTGAPPTSGNLDTLDSAAAPQLESGEMKKRRTRKAKAESGKPTAASNKRKDISCGGMWCPAAPSPEALAEKEAEKAARAERKRERGKNDPRYVAAARELCDRYLDEVNAGRVLIEGAGKYDVSRQLDGADSAMKVAPTPLLAAA